MIPIRKIGEVLIAWVPDRPDYPGSLRGTARIEAAPGVGLESFPRRAGYFHPGAHDSSDQLRQAYVLKIARDMWLDGIDADPVLMYVQEYLDISQRLNRTIQFARTTVPAHPTSGLAVASIREFLEAASEDQPPRLHS